MTQPQCIEYSFYFLASEWNGRASKRLLIVGNKQVSLRLLWPLGWNSLGWAVARLIENLNQKFSTLQGHETARQLSVSKKLWIIFIIYPLFFFQAQFQAQQMAEKEKRLLHMMETRQEETVRRIAYGTHGRIDSAPHSATSLSSNNSSTSFTAGVGQRPGPQGGKVRQFFKEQRSQLDSGSVSGHSKGTSPVGWDKSYPLRPVNVPNDPGLPPGRGTIYKKNSNASQGKNKYSGNYGPKSMAQVSKDPYKGRGLSLDRNRANSRFTSPSRGVNPSMTRTKSQVLLGNTGFSSGEDSYGSSSRPPSSSREWTINSTPMYASRSHRDLISVNNRNGIASAHSLSRSNSRTNMNHYSQWLDNDDVIDGIFFPDLYMVMFF